MRRAENEDKEESKMISRLLMSFVVSQTNFKFFFHLFMFKNQNLEFKSAICNYQMAGLGETLIQRLGFMLAFTVGILSLFGSFSGTCRQPKPADDKRRAADGRDGSQPLPSAYCEHVERSRKNSGSEQETPPRFGFSAFSAP